MRLRRKTSSLSRGFLLCAVLALIAGACAGKKDIVFQDDGRQTGGDAGAPASGGAATDSGTGAAGPGGAAGNPGGGPTGPGGPSRFAVVPGGNQMSSANYTLILTTGEAPQGNQVMSSANYELTTGVLSSITEQADTNADQ